MKRWELLRFGRYIPIVSLCILSISIISIPVFAQQMSFTASLSGQSLTPPVSTTATGTAKFNVDTEGNIAYQIDVKNIEGVIGAHISLQNGTDLAQVFNPYVEIAGKSGIPTGEVNGQLSKGVLTSTDLSGPLMRKNVTELANLMKNGSVNVVVRTQAHEKGEIQGLINLSNSTSK
jgi:hypothetical protein